MNYTNNQLLKYGVAKGQIPQYIYRYRPIDEFFDDIFIKNSLWLSNPLDFNDPFDCRILIDTKNTVDEIRSYFVKQNVPIKIAHELAKKTLEKPQGFNKSINKTLEGIISSSGICCFSQVYDNILMWSHYTDSHKGVCLKYDITKDSDFFVTPVVVNYQKKYEQLNYITEQDKIVDKLISAKSLDWEYEKEIRIIKPTSSGLIKFKKEALIEVLFGCKTEDKEIKRIKKLLGDNGYLNVKFKKAQLRNVEYGLNFKAI